MCADQNARVVLRDSIPHAQTDLLRAVLGSTNYGFMLTNLEHVTIACNERFGQLFGIDHRQVVRNNVLAVRAMVENRIGDLDEWKKNLETVYADPMTTQIDELVLQNPPARLRRWTGPVLSESGDPIGRLWTFLDTTREARIRAMGETLAQIAAFFDSEPSKVYQHVVELVGLHYGSISLLSVRVGDFMEFRAAGGPSDAVRGIRGNQLDDSYCQFCLERDAPLIIQDARQSSAYGNVLPAQLGLTRYAGVPIRSPDGHSIGTLCILDDRSAEELGEEDLRFLQIAALRISGELDRELQIRALKDDLNARDETLRRTHHELIQSEKLAFTGMFAAAIAHDIRNIHSAMILELSLCADKPEEGLRMVQDHLNRLNVLSHRLLSYARPADVALEDVHLPEVLDSVMRLLQAHLRISGIEAELVHDEGLPPVKADPVRLEHLFVNLSMNAIQAMSAGGKLSIRTRAEADAVIAEVGDSGKGIPPARLGKLFEPFNSVRKEGFGLGLYSCQQIMRESGGDIFVRSEEGRGTTFTLRFPR